jgi:NitT/TauT family transport system permease protein
MKKTTWSQNAWKLGPIVMFVALWEVAARYAIFSMEQLFPPFSVVLIELYGLFQNGLMTESLLSTLVRVLLGLCLGAFSGVAVGTAMGWGKAVNRSLSPVISIFYPIPALGWLPLLMIWIGINEMLPVAIITISSFFPVCYSTSAGIRNVDKEIIKASQILGASDIQILFRVIFPIAAPHIFAGLKLSSGMAWRTVLAAEMVAIPTGIGALLMRAESLVRVDIIMACLFVLSVMCLLLEKGFGFMENRLVGKWSECA